MCKNCLFTMGIKTFQNLVIWVIQKINIYSTLRVICDSKIQRLYTLYMFWRMGNKTLFFTFDDHFGNTGLLYEPLYGFYSTNVASLRMYMLSKQNRKKISNMSHTYLFTHKRTWYEILAAILKKGPHKKSFRKHPLSSDLF